MKYEFVKKMIADGLLNGYVKIINNPNDNCISCQIGAYWFYFIGDEYENMTVSEVLTDFPIHELADMICKAMANLFDDEIEYYINYLLERYDAGHKKSKDFNMFLWNKLKRHMGHNVEICAYGESTNEDICLECNDCGEIIIDAGLYTLVARNDEE